MKKIKRNAPRGTRKIAIKKKPVAKNLSSHKAAARQRKKVAAKKKPVAKKKSVSKRPKSIIEMSKEKFDYFMEKIAAI